MRAFFYVAMLPLIWTLSSCGEASVKIPEQLTVVYVAPHHGAVNVSVSSTIEVGFNGELEGDSITDKSIKLLAGSTTIPTEKLIDNGKGVITIVPESVLPTATQLEIVIGEDLKGTKLGTLGQTVRSRFRTQP